MIWTLICIVLPFVLSCVRYQRTTPSFAFPSLLGWSQPNVCSDCQIFYPALKIPSLKMNRAALWKRIYLILCVKNRSIPNWCLVYHYNHIILCSYPENVRNESSASWSKLYKLDVWRWTILKPAFIKPDAYQLNLLYSFQNIFHQYFLYHILKVNVS